MPVWVGLGLAVLLVTEVVGLVVVLVEDGGVVGRGRPLFTSTQ